MEPVRFEFNGFFSTELIESITKSVLNALHGFEFESFLLGCSFPYSVSEDEKALLKKQFQFALVDALRKSMNKKPVFERPDISIIVDFNSRKVSFEVASVFVLGRYNKFSRQIAQTVFYCPKCKGRGCTNCQFKGKLGLETVEELIGKQAQPLFNAAGFAFHGAGREDVDVRMLGNGRPFVLELIEPKKRSMDLSLLQKTINQTANEKIKIFDLAYCTKKKVSELKEDRHEKKYAVIVQCERKFDQKKLVDLHGKSFVVAQQTPLRVVGRRADIVRNRNCHIELVKPLDDTSFEIVLVTEAGLYVKEFVSGENGRSQPSLSGLLDNSCECKQLDVLEVIEK